MTAFLKNGQKFWADTSALKMQTDGKEYEKVLNITSFENDKSK